MNTFVGCNCLYINWPLCMIFGHDRKDFHFTDNIYTLLFIVHHASGLVTKDLIFALYILMYNPNSNQRFVKTEQLLPVAYHMHTYQCKCISSQADQAEI